MASKPSRDRHKGGRPPKGAKPRTPVQAAFLEAYAQLGSITAAAKVADCHPSRHRNDWVNDPAYLKDFQEAAERANDALEDEARRRGKDGVWRMKFHQGEMITVPAEEGEPGAFKVAGKWRKPYIEHEYSDTLLTLLLKANRPTKFRERLDVQHSGGVTYNKQYGADAPVESV